MNAIEANRVIGLVKEAQKLGREAGEKQYQKLLKAGDRWKVIEEPSGKEVGRLLDVCGIGMLIVPGHGKIVRAFKTVGRKVKLSDSYAIAQDVLIWKSHKGYGLSLFLTNKQEMSVNEEAVKAVAIFLEVNGLKCKWRCNID